jgi:hypothetical protein
MHERRAAADDPLERQPVVSDDDLAATATNDDDRPHRNANSGSPQRPPGRAADRRGRAR